MSEQKSPRAPTGRRGSTPQFNATQKVKKISDKQFNLDEIEEHFPCRQFSKPPVDRPRAIVIDINEPEKMILSYPSICTLLKLIFPKTDLKEKISSIEYENCNVICNSKTKPERWIIETNDFIFRNRIFNTIGDLIPAKDKKNVNVRMYTNVRSEEYRRYLRFNGAKDKLKDYLLSAKVNTWL